MMTKPSQNVFLLPPGAIAGPAAQDGVAQLVERRDREAGGQRARSPRVESNAEATGSNPVPISEPLHEVRVVPGPRAARELAANCSVENRSSRWAHNPEVVGSTPTAANDVSLDSGCQSGLTVMHARGCGGARSARIHRTPVRSNRTPECGPSCVPSTFPGLDRVRTAGLLLLSSCGSGGAPTNNRQSLTCVFSPSEQAGSCPCRANGLWSGVRHVCEKPALRAPRGLGRGVPAGVHAAPRPYIVLSVSAALGGAAGAGRPACCRAASLATTCAGRRSHIPLPPTRCTARRRF